MILSCPVNESSFIFSFMPTILSGIVLIALFLAGRYIDMKIKKQAIRGEWYLNVIINPNIFKLEEFYKEIAISTAESIESLITNSEISHDKFLGLISEELGNFQKKKRTFEMEFLALIKTNYPLINEELDKLMRDLEDEIALIYDKKELNRSDKSTIEQLIYDAKYKLLKVLFKPLEFKVV